jgi:hypothetical protein
VNYLQRSFQISFALHAAVLLLLIFIGDRFIIPEKVLVIDFTSKNGLKECRDSRVKTRREPNAP